MKQILNTKRMILIVAPPGNLQIGLQALLTAHLDAHVLVTGKGSSALQVIEIHKPAIVILDEDLLEDAFEMIFQSNQTSYPGAVLIVIVNEEDSRQKMLGKGADYALLKGFSPQKLVALIGGLLSQMENQDRIEHDSKDETMISSEGGAYAD